MGLLRCCRLLLLPPGCCALPAIPRCYLLRHTRYAKYGDLAQTKAAVQSAVMWQVISNPLEQGPFAPVIRGNPWGLDKGTVNDDWPYVIFDWDNHFGAYMLSLDSKELGYSALIQVVKAKTGEGFVPNTAASVNKARHSQPPVGSKVLLQMFRKYNESWVVELLFADLLDWNNWFERARRLPPLNIIALGSEEGVLQDARFESGLDNSPMYDAGNWGHGQSSFADDKMQLYDVGMASMHAMDCLALAELATAIGRDDTASMLRRRGQEQSALIEGQLWDEAAGIYVNRKPSGVYGMSGEFVARVSPTSFYAMQTAGPNASRVERLVRGGP